MKATRAVGPAARFPCTRTPLTFATRGAVPGRSTQHLVRSWAQPEVSPQAVSDTIDDVPQGCSRYTVELTRPLGMALEEDGQGGIAVAEVYGGGNAERCGEIKAGDSLISTSGNVFTRESEYQGNMVKSGEKRITLNVRGEKFDTVMAAIGTHRAGQAVQLTFQRC